MNNEFELIKNLNYLALEIEFYLNVLIMLCNGAHIVIICIISISIDLGLNHKTKGNHWLIT